MTPLAELVGARIKRERTRRGLSMRELSAKSGAGINTISRIERGNDAVFSSIAAVAGALSVSLDALVAPSACAACDGMPPAWMTCNQCGREGGTP